MGMTIDGAIAHAREVAKRRMAEYENHYDKDAHYYPMQCKKMCRGTYTTCGVVGRIKAVPSNRHSGRMSYCDGELKEGKPFRFEKDEQEKRKERLIQYWLICQS